MTKVLDKENRFPQDEERDECRYLLKDGLSGVLLEVAEGLTVGARKHPGATWRRIPTEEHLARAFRHILKYCDGDRMEDHLSHIVMRSLMAMACAREKSIRENNISDK